MKTQVEFLRQIQVNSGTYKIERIRNSDGESYRYSHLFGYTFGISPVGIHNWHQISSCKINRCVKITAEEIQKKFAQMQIRY